MDEGYRRYICFSQNLAFSLLGFATLWSRRPPNGLLEREIKRELSPTTTRKRSGWDLNTGPAVNLRNTNICCIILVLSFKMILCILKESHLPSLSHQYLTPVAKSCPHIVYVDFLTYSAGLVQVNLLQLASRSILY